MEVVSLAIVGVCVVTVSEGGGGFKEQRGVLVGLR